MTAPLILSLLEILSHSWRGRGELGLFWRIILLKSRLRFNFIPGIRRLVLLTMFYSICVSFYSFGLGTYFASYSDELRILVCGRTKYTQTNSLGLYLLAIPPALARTTGLSIVRRAPNRAEATTISGYICVEKITYPSPSFKCTPYIARDVPHSLTAL